MNSLINEIWTPGLALGLHIEIKRMVEIDSTPHIMSEMIFSSILEESLNFPKLTYHSPTIALTIALIG